MHILPWILSALGATAPDASLISLGSDLRSLTQGSEAVGFDPAAVGWANGFELHYRHRLLPDDDSSGRYGTYGVASLGALKLYGGFEWLRIPTLRHERRTLGAALRLHEGLTVGIAQRRLTAPRIDLDGVVLWDASVNARPYSWLSLSLGVDAFNSPTLAFARRRPGYVAGVAVRPWAGARFLEVGGELSLLPERDGSTDYNVRRVRALVEYTPSEGLHLLGAYDRIRDNDADIDQFWVGVGVSLGNLVVGAAGLGGGSGGLDAASDVGWRATLRSQTGESLWWPPKTAEVVVAGDLIDGTSLFGRKTVSTLAYDLRALADNPRVEGVVVHIRGLEVGLASVEDLRQALKYLRSRGKEVVATISNTNERGYLIAAAADRIRMDAAATLTLDGFSVTARYFADTLKKVGVRFDAVAIGSYKTAPDALTRSSPRPEDKAIRAELIDSAFALLKNVLRDDRDLDDVTLEKVLTRGFFDARGALERGLIDEVEGPLEPDESVRPRRRGVRPSALAIDADRWGSTPKVAVVPVVGTIVGSPADNPLPGATAGAGWVVRALERARQDDRIVGVVLRVESPGGDVTASDQIWRAVRRVQERKPVVVSMGDVAASGGYYVAAPADRIFAQPNTITGSIGIFSVKPDLSGFYQWIGLGNDVIQRGPHADWDGTTHPLRAEDRKRLRRNLQIYYDSFLAKVAAGRGMELGKVKSIAEGRVYTGARAAELGLVDAVGGLDAAVQDVRERAGLSPEDALDLWVPEQRWSLVGLLRTLATGSNRHPLGEVLELEKRVRRAAGRAWMLMPYEYRVEP